MRSRNRWSAPDILGAGRLPVVLGRWQCKVKSGAFSQFAFYPDPAPVIFNNSFHEGKTNSCALTFGIQLVEQPKYAFVIFRCDPHAIILDEEDRLAVLFSALSNFDERLGLRAHIFGGVIQKILQDLYQTLTVSVDNGQIGLGPNRDTV